MKQRIKEKLVETIEAVVMVCIIIFCLWIVTQIK